MALHKKSVVILPAGLRCPNGLATARLSPASYQTAKPQRNWAPKARNMKAGLSAKGAEYESRTERQRRGIWAGL